MPSVYTPAAVKLTTVTEPVGGELRNVASVVAMTRKIADGVKFNTDQLVPLADLTALAAIAVPTDGMVRHVQGFGWFEFLTAYTTGLFPFRVAAADATVGGWKSSTVHEASVTRIVGAAKVCGISSSAGTKAGANPATLWTEFVPVAAADVVRKLGAAFLAAGTLGGATLQYGYMLPLDEYLIDGATLSTVTAYLQGGGAHIALPSRMPKLAVVRANLLQIGTATITNVAMKSTGNGYTTDSTATAGAFDNVHTIVQATDQNNVIDRTLYSYYAVFLDEDGTNSTGGTYFQAIALTMTAIPDARRS